METVTKIITVQLLEAHHMEKKVNQKFTSTETLSLSD